MNLNKLLAMLKPKPKPRPIYLGDVLVGWDDGLPNSVKIDRLKMMEGLMGRPVNSTWYDSLLGLGLRLPSQYPDVDYEYTDIGLVAAYTACAGVSIGGGYQQIRSRRNKKFNYALTYYFAEIGVARATTDVGLWKCVAGTNTQLATEAVDLTADDAYQILLQATGTTIKIARGQDTDWGRDPDATVPSADFKITVTDTAISSGMVNINNHTSRYTPSTYWGAQSYWQNAWTISRYDWRLIRPPSSPSPEPLTYFEMPIEFFDLPEVNEDGTVNLTRQFYGVKMPEEIVTMEKPIPESIRKKKEILERKGWSLEEIRAFLPEAFPTEKINRLAVTKSALIPTNNKGKPTDSIALVRIFESSPEYCHPIEKRIQAIKEMRGVRQLSREEAIDLARKLDDRLHIHDLVPCTKHDLGGKCFQEYRDWRIHTIGDKPEFADTDIRKRYVKETKGW